MCRTQLPKRIRNGNNSSLNLTLRQRFVPVMSCNKLVPNYQSPPENAIFEVSYLPNWNSNYTFENDLEQLGPSSSKRCKGVSREKLTVSYSVIQLQKVVSWYLIHFLNPLRILFDPWTLSRFDPCTLNSKPETTNPTQETKNKKQQQKTINYKLQTINYKLSTIDYKY